MLIETAVAHIWHYPSEERFPAPESGVLPPQTLMICAEPADHASPWVVILEDRKTMYCFSALTIEGLVESKTDWKADNVWFPKMWLEVHGVLQFSNSVAQIRAVSQ